MGLLSSYLVDKISYNPIYDIGICPHYSEKHYPVFNKILKENPNSIILDTLDNPVEFLLKMKQCKTVISSGLHPLIAADSLGIPNLWVRVSEGLPVHKYKDYYSVFDIDPKPYYLFDNSSLTSEIIIKAYKLNNTVVEKKKEELFLTHQKFFIESGIK